VKKTSKTVPKRGARPSGAAPRAQQQRKQKQRQRPQPGAVGRRRRGAPAPPAVEPAAAPLVEVPAPAAEAASPPADLVLATPEPAFADRVLPPEPERPLASARRAIFFDVENTSRPEHISRVVDHLAVDRLGQRTDFIAVGNWRVIGHDTARLLARHGAHLVHSAPSVGVRDWSDLRIAVSAGVWLAGARPGDVIEIVTNDRAFDAVGDVASSLGIAFRRLSHQGLVGAAPEPEAPAREADRDRESRLRRRGGRGRRRGGWRAGLPGGAPAPEPPAPAPPPPPPPAMPAPRRAEPAAAPLPDVLTGTGAEPHTAPHDEIIAVVHELIERSPTGAVTLDSLANALKSRGFSRTPGSPRLITRLRRIREISVSRSGVITMVEGQAGGPPPVARPPAAEAAPVEEPEAMAAEVAEEEGPGPGNELVPSAPAAPPGDAARRRRSRRGGRGRRPRPHPAQA
jgi:hypothetical protein